MFVGNKHGNDTEDERIGCEQSIVKREEWLKFLRLLITPAKLFYSASTGAYCHAQCRNPALP